MSEAAEDARRFGLSEEFAARLAGIEKSDGLFGVWRQNWKIVTAFLSVATQWRALPLADGRVYWMGLDYTAVSVRLEKAALPLSPSEWDALQIMERAARDAQNGVRG